ncbi:HU family DNA-binding protein [Prevotella sp. HUN102]|uniref:HU family DNA-binding protein n=1 Tax=Prevotella sp. HUN102 TaxID=1392486 RepID=UPI000490F423|nr:HU family DNA-binding protein [Prevotella sp. HUN102]
MAFYKKVLKKINNKWYPQSVLVGKPITTEQIAKRLATESTVSPADVRAVLTALGSVMGDYMAQGRSVKLDGIGTFYFTATASKNGVETKEKVTANQINGVRVRFVPETYFRRTSGTRIATRTLTDTNIYWEEWHETDEPNHSSKDSESEEDSNP